MTTSLMTPDTTRWSMLRLEHAEYSHGTPMCIELDCGSCTDWEMDDNQPLMCIEYVHGVHDDADWDSIDEQAMLDESDYWFSMGIMTVR